ncbi:MAG: Yip1 family protein [Aliishimia sp.]
MTLTWRDLGVKTVQDPAQAAQLVMSVPMVRRDIWLGVIAVACLNALFSSLLTAMSPVTTQEAQALPLLAVSPLPKALIIAGLLVLLSHVLTWVGRAMGGSGQIDDMLKLMVWMQLVAMVLQALNLVILIAVPLIGSILVMAIVIIMFRILLNFIKVGHGFTTMGNAALVLFASFIGMIVGISVLLVLSGVGNLGVVPSV